MLSPTHQALEKFDNQHDFERLSADLLNATGNSNVVPIAPKGGSDGGKDITYINPSGEKGLACVSLRKDAKIKFMEDVKQRKAGEYSEYLYFTNQYLTANEKVELALHCGNNLKAVFIARDIEAIRSMLDTTYQDIRKSYLNIAPSTLPIYSFELTEVTTYSADKISGEAVERHRETAEKFQSKSKMANALPINIPSLAVESTEDVLNRLSRHIDELNELSNKLVNIFSFNMIIKSDSYDENIQVNVESNDANTFTFEDSLLVLPDIPSASQRSQFDTILGSRLYTSNLGNIAARNKDEFYARLSNSGNQVITNISSLNPNQPKSIFDEPVFVLGLESLKSITLKVTVYSKNLAVPQISEILINPSKAKLIELSY
jgi:hypothetical protein